MSLATLEPQWDALVVGAGVAGSTLAALLAREGWKTLLLDRATFPRRKVCGCCLSPATVQLLHRLKLGDCLADAIPLREARIAVHGRQYVFPHGGAAVSRAALDQRLTDLARRDGATFLAGVWATDAGVAAERRRVHARCDGVTRTLEAQVVFVADGIGGHFAQAIPSMRWAVAKKSRLGMAAILPAGTLACPRDAVLMAVGRGGYAGVVQLEDRTINVAAAIDPGVARASGGAGRLVSELLREAGMNADLSSAIWHGTPLLTRRRGMLGAARLLAVGDACAYEEPFTGEGMKWAALSAASLASLLGAPARAEWDDALPVAWTRRHRRLLGGSMSHCRTVSRLLRHPSLLAITLWMPRPLADTIMRGIARPPPEHAYCTHEISL